MSERHLQACARVLFPNQLSALLEHRAHKVKCNAGAPKTENVKQSQSQACPKCSTILVPGITCYVRAKKSKNGCCEESKVKSQSKNRRNRARNLKKLGASKAKFEARLKAKLGENYKETTDLRYLEYRCTACNGILLIDVTPAKSSKPNNANFSASNESHGKLPKPRPTLGSLNFSDFLL